MNDVKVTTLIITYNHAKFIRQAIESVLEQDTDFDHEIIISEDFSIDGTRHLVEDYARRHPHLIRLLLSDRNIRSNEVVARGIREAKGRFVALLDGDDYWLSREKLQTQADFLETHQDCPLCFHNARIEGPAVGNSRNWTPPDQPRWSSLDDILRGNFIATCSVMFRRGLFEIPAWYDDFFPITDWPLHILNAQYGRIGYIDQVLGVYRQHEGGLFSTFSLDRKLDEIFGFYESIYHCLGQHLKPRIRCGMCLYFLEWAEEFLNRDDPGRAKKCLSKAWRGRPFQRRGLARRYLRNWIRLQRRVNGPGNTDRSFELPSRPHPSR